MAVGPVVIAADPSIEEQMVLAEMYRQVLELDGREVLLVGRELKTNTEQIDTLMRGDADLTVVCTGTLVVETNPSDIGELQKKVDADEGGNNDLELLTAVYDAAIATLPSAFTTTDPSPAEGCAGMIDGEEAEKEMEGWPRNIIPIIRKSEFDRIGQGAVNAISRALSTEDLDEIVEKSKQGQNRARLVNEWMMKRTGMGSELPRRLSKDEGFEDAED